MYFEFKATASGARPWFPETDIGRKFAKVSKNFCLPFYLLCKYMPEISLCDL